MLIIASFAFKLMKKEEQSIVLSSNPTEPIKVKAGSNFAIQFRSNPSTGYRWTLATAVANQNVVKALNNEYKPDPAPAPVNGRPAMSGGGGVTSFRFNANKAGKHTLIFNNIGPGRSVPTQVIKVDVEVN